MKKIIFLISFVLIFSFTMHTEAQNDVKSIESHHVITIINGKRYIANTYLINGSNYFQLRKFADLISNEIGAFDVGYDSKSNTIELIKNKSYKEKNSQLSSVLRDPKTIQLKDTKIKVGAVITTLNTYVIDGYTYFKLRDLGELLNYSIGFDEKTGNVSVTMPTPNNVVLIGTAKENRSSEKVVIHPRWSKLNTEFLAVNSDGTTTFVEVEDNQNSGVQISITKLDGQHKVLSEKILPKELNKFGTFYSGEKYNYIAYGQRNLEESNKEVIRIVKYDKDFNRISHASFYGADLFTTLPFESSNGGQMTEVEDYLFFHTSRKRFRTSDGLNHQSNLTIILDIESMKLMNKLEEFQDTHVSHSFHQLVLNDNERNLPVYLDHGDAYPRSIVLQKYRGRYLEAIDVFDIKGLTGANVTGVSIGGFDQSKSHYLVAFNSIIQSNNYQYGSSSLIGADMYLRNIYVYAVDKLSSPENPIIVKTEIANYQDSKLYTTTPTLVKINDDKFLVLWQEFNNENRSLWQESINVNRSLYPIKYLYVNGEGEAISAIKELESYLSLSEMQPIVIGQEVLWITRKNNKNYLFKMKVE